MADFELNLNHSALQQVGIDHARTLVTRVIRRTLNRSAVLCPVDNGPLRASGKMEPATVFGNQVRGGVVYDIEYAAAVHNGRRAMTIRPRRGKYLRFTVGGRVVYARQVHQPARKGRPYLATALREVAEPEGFRVTIG